MIAAGLLGLTELEAAVGEQRRAEAKRMATATARAALRGIVLQRIEADGGGAVFIASKGALTRQLGDLAAVEAWLDRIGAPA